MCLLKTEQLTLVLFLLVFMLCGCSDGQMLLKEQVYQGFACYGDHDEYAFINPSCPSGSVIAAGNVEYGAKLRNLTKCRGYILRNDTIDYYKLCCKPDTANANTDCLLEIQTDSPYLLCTGRPLCNTSIRAQWVQTSNTKCDNMSYGSVYATSFTSYVIFTYFCVEETRIYSVNSVNTTINASIVYLWNTGYPYHQIQANTTNACSIELENCSAYISVITLHVDLPTTSNGTCNQTIRFLTSNGELVQNLSCSVYRNISYIYTSSDTYLYIETENLSDNQSGHFWLGFRASESTTFHVHCPGKNRTYCTPTTATWAATSTTMMTNITTTITSMTTASPPTSMMTTKETLTPSTTTSTSKTTASSTSSSIPTIHPTRSSTTLSSATTVNATNASLPPVDKSDNDSKIGIIIGIVVSGIALTSVITLCVICRRLKLRVKRKREKNVFQTESTISRLQVGAEAAPIDHSVVIKTSETRTRKEIKLKANAPQEGQMDGGNDERGKRKREKRKKKKHKEHQANNNIMQAADSDQQYLQMGHMKEEKAWENELIALLDIRDKSKTTIRVDPVPDDTEKRHRTRKKRLSERFKGIEGAVQTEDENNPDNRGRRKKKRKKQTRKEDKRRSNDVEEPLPSFEEDMHTFENKVYPSGDSK